MEDFGSQEKLLVEPDAEEEVQRCSKFASAAHLIVFLFTQIIGILSVILIFIWAGEYKGIGWEGHTKYCWHPILAVVGAVYLFSAAVCSFRLLPCKRPTVKILHICLEAGAVFSVLFAFGVEVSIKTEFNSNHFRSFHSWLGLVAVLLLFIQWPVNLVIWYFNWSSVNTRVTLMPWHKRFGMATGLICFAAIITGIQSQIRKAGDSERLLLNTVGVLSVILAITQTFVLIENRCKFNR